MRLQDSSQQGAGRVRNKLQVWGLEFRGCGFRIFGVGVYIGFKTSSLRALRSVLDNVKAR